MTSLKTIGMAFGICLGIAGAAMGTIAGVIWTFVNYPWMIPG